MKTYSLTDLGKQLRKAITAAVDQPDRQRAETICQVTRELWFAYHEQWLTNSRECRKIDAQFGKDLGDGLRIVEQIRDGHASPGEHDGELATLLGQYADSIARRLELHELLHSESDPWEGARRVYERLREEFAA